MGRIRGWVFATLVLSACSGARGKADDGGDGGDDDDDDASGFEWAAVCEAHAQCSGPPVDECLDDMDDAMAEAIDRGCGRDLIDYGICFLAEFECEGGYAEADVCAEEVNIYLGCMGAAYGTEPTTPDTDTEPDVAYVFEASVDCARLEPGADIDLFVRASLTDGTQAIVDMADTVHTSSWYESHILLPTTSANGLTEFEATLVSDQTTYAESTSSLYSCQAGTHIDPSVADQVMTYVVRTHDSTDRLWDCFATGHDPERVLSGDYETWGNQAFPADVHSANCSALRSAR